MNASKLPEPILQAKQITLEGGLTVFSQGEKAESFIVVTDGCVRVYARSEQGKEVVLYRVLPGELCILTTSCLIGHTRYPANAVTEAPTTARVIPLRDFERFMDELDSFRQFVFANMGSRLAQVTQRFERMVLDSVNRRLAAFLLSRSESDPVVKITQEQLAIEIGTAREVISRHLNVMKSRGSVSLERGKIEVIDRLALGQVD